MQNTKQFFLALILAVSCISTIGYAADSAQNPTSQNTTNEPSAEARKQMAAAHKKMADCLASSKSMAECRKEMQTTMKSMHDQYGNSCCGEHHQMGGMMGHGDEHHDCW